MYTLAAGAAGVCILALAQPAEAKIVYTPANIRLGMNQHYDLDLNHDGITDFSIWDIRKVSKNPQCTPDVPWIRDSLVVGQSVSYGERVEGGRLRGHSLRASTSAVASVSVLICRRKC
jgi:hypothetical protein